MDNKAIADTASSVGEEEYYDADGDGHLQAEQTNALGADGDTSGQSSDDVFLKVANDASQSKLEEDHSRPERRLSRARRPLELSSPTFASAGSQPRRNSTNHDSEYAARATPLLNETSLPARRRTSASGATAYSAVPARNLATASSEQRLNAYRSKYLASKSLSPTLPQRPESVSCGYRRPSVPDAMYNRAQLYRPSRLHTSAGGEYQNDTASESRRASLRAESRLDAGESMTSQTAQSAVWDELHELKSRLQKIEFGDKPQPTTFSSGGTMSNGSNERPRTATTTITTMSSSPKVVKPVSSTGEETIGGPGAAAIHPLLHQSLSRCKQTLPPSLYRSLETAASDALELAVLTGSSGNQSSMLSSASIINGAVTDRQLRRKADNVCRSLTDLCISLCEGNFDVLSAANQRPGSRGVSNSFNSPVTVSAPYTRHSSLEPEPIPARPTPSRALDRVEARRTSLMSMTLNTNSSPRESGPTARRNSGGTGSAAQSPREVSKLPRIGTSLQRTRGRAGAEDEDDASHRPVSRATTDIGAAFRERASRLGGALLSPHADRKYTSQHPLPALSNNASLPKPTPLRRMGGTTFTKLDESNSAPSSLQRDRTQKYLNRDGEPMYLTPDVSTDDERQVRRRSLGLYSSARSSLTGLGRTSSLSKRSVVAGGD